MEASGGLSDMSTAEILRAVVAEKLTTAAQEILAVVERTVAGYEEEASGLRQEIDRQRRQLEVLLQPQIKVETIDDQFPVCEPAAGGGAGAGGGGGRPPAEEEQHKHEPSVEDDGGLGLICYTEVQMEDAEEEEEEDQEHLAEPDYEAAARLSPPTVQSDRKRTGRCRISEPQDHVDLRICILEDSQIEVLSVRLFKKNPIRELRCPCGLQEEDFLDLLRSTFPQLADQKPFDVFTTDRTRRLQPLRVETLTPEEISSTTGHSALYIRLKKQEELKSTDEEFHPSQRKDAAADSASSSDQTSLLLPRVQSGRRKTDRPRISETQNHVDLKIRILEDSQIEVITPNVYKKYPAQELRCPYGLQEADFLDLLRSTFPQQAAQKPFDIFTTDVARRLQPLEVEPLTPEEIHSTTGLSALYIRLKSPEEVQAREKEPLRRKDAAAAKVSPSTDRTGLKMRVQSDKRKSGRRHISEPQDHVDLSIRILEESRINVITPNVFKKYPVHELQCPCGLQEEDFLDLLRSTFPQLAAQKPFDIFTTDGNKRLQLLRVEALTPEEVHRTAGCSTLYIRLKEQEEVQANEAELQDFSSSSDQTRLNARRSPVLSSSSTSQHEDMETEEADDEDGGRSESSLLVLSENNGDGGEVSDDDWKPVKREKHLSESEAEKTTRKRRVERSGLQMTPLSTKASTDNGDAPLSCKVCRALRGSMNMLIKHAWSHVDDPERLCGVCGEHSESAEELRSHFQRHQKTHSCNICGKSFLSISGLNGHVARHKGRKPYKCNTCHKAFALKSVLRNHKWVHAADKPQKCDICPKSFMSKTELTRHRVSHTGEKLHRCDMCGKSLCSLRALSQHMQSHSVRETTFDCEICSKTCPTKQNLKNHMRSHSTERPHVCSKCNKGFLCKSNLETHMRVHTREKPYKCSVCDMAFSQRFCVDRHMKSHQDGSDDCRTEAPVQVLSERKIDAVNGTKSAVKRVR